MTWLFDILARGLGFSPLFISDATPPVISKPSVTQLVHDLADAFAYGSAAQSKRDIAQRPYFQHSGLAAASSRRLERLEGGTLFRLNTPILLANGCKERIVPLLEIVAKTMGATEERPLRFDLHNKMNRRDHRGKLKRSAHNSGWAVDVYGAGFGDVMTTTSDEARRSRAIIRSFAVQHAFRSGRSELQRNVLTEKLIERLAREGCPIACLFLTAASYGTVSRARNLAQIIAPWNCPRSKSDQRAAAFLKELLGVDIWYGKHNRDHQDHIHLQPDGKESPRIS